MKKPIGIFICIFFKKRAKHDIEFAVPLKYDMFE